MSKAKTSSAVALPDDNGVAEVSQTATAMIEVRVDAADADGFAVRHFNFRLTDKEAKKLKQLRTSLHKSGATYFDGRIDRHIDRHHDVFRWLLSQIEVA